jgi:hypothetical protein
MRPGDPDSFATFAELTITADGERVVCHECGNEQRAVGIHAWWSHGITAAEYRTRHGLSTGRSLASPVSSARMSAHARASPNGLAALRQHGDHARARAAMTHEGQTRPERVAIRIATGRRARLGRPLSAEEIKRLKDAATPAVWVDTAREIIASGTTARAIACDLELAQSTVASRILRAEPRHNTTSRPTPRLVAPRV